MPQRFRRASARLTSDAVRRMGSLPWFSALPPEERSFVGLVVQAGLDEFGAWLKDTRRPRRPTRRSSQLLRAPSPAR